MKMKDLRIFITRCGVRIPPYGHSVIVEMNETDLDWSNLGSKISLCLRDAYNKEEFFHRQHTLRALNRGLYELSL
jgi:hypothetical protein